MRCALKSPAIIGLTSCANPSYGKKTQHLRDALRGQWFGWHDSGDPSPAIFLTEGGARLDQFDPNIATDGGPNTDYSTNPPSDPAAAVKRLQASSVGGSHRGAQEPWRGRPGR